MQNLVAIIDYGMGNLHSIEKKLKRLGCRSIITNKQNEIQNANKIILPGVGHFHKAMQNLNELNLIDILNQEVIQNKKPVLGICLGMQLMTQYGEEGEAKGLGWFEAKVVKFKIKNSQYFKIPHIGWNQIEIQKKSALMNGIPNLSEFYFVHSYHVETNQQTDILNISNYEYNFVSALEKENIFGVQYHPEKSHDLGELILENFVLL